MTQHFFNDTLQNAQSRISVSPKAGKILLDKNEQPYDIDPAMKARVLDGLMQCDWHRYPNADLSDIETRLAEYCGLNQEQIVVAPGSANIICALLNYFALNQKQIHIAQPSYSLFDYHCKTYNIPYTPWLLTADLEFDYDHMPQLGKGSVLIITSPNNPTGNTIDTDQLESLLKRFPESMIILDGVYTEFTQEDVTPLVNTYNNLMVLRSLSKAFPVAGLRLGYLCANKEMAAVVRKLMLPFSITPFSLCFVRELFGDPEFMASSKHRVQELIAQREIMYVGIQDLFPQDALTVYRSEGNFLLIRIHDDGCFANLMEDFIEAGIKVLNTHAAGLMKNTFRVSVGSEAENFAFMQCLAYGLESNYYTRDILNENIGLEPSCIASVE
ncbi:MAG: aminotransferase class I/II-fold pyridoxal phosphate-dependent enzyme [Chitinophagaceae bacterium]|nr:aminotransferase class I/II-fold pyridoxal phosphate-dependent enzyme [Chitinophagaceae bacterium]